MELILVLQHTQIHINEEYFDLVDRPTKEERQLIKESIIINGQREPIIINEKYEILDGHTRFEICRELGLQVKAVIKQFNDKLQEKLYVIGVNLERRQFSKFQKFEHVYKQYLLEKQYAKKRHYRGSLPPKGRAIEIVGKSIGMSAYMFYMCVYLKQNADNKTIEKLRRGEIAISTTYAKIRQKESVLRRLGSRLHSESIVKCPCCQNEFKRKDLIVVKR